MASRVPTMAGSLPPWAEWVLDDPEGVVDGSSILAAGGSPMGDTLALAERVAPGRGFVVKAPFDPTPLRTMLESMGFESAAAPAADGHWRAVFRKPPTG